VIPLTDKEMLEATQVNMFLPNGELDPDQGYLTGRKQVAKAQLNKVVEWLFAECDNEEHEHGNSGCEFLRYECEECRQALLDEVK